MATLNSIAKALCLANPQLRRVGRWLIYAPIQHVAVGVILDGSGDKRIVRPTTVISPLYLAELQLGFGFGDRFPGRYEYDSENLEGRIVAQFNELVNPLVPKLLDIAGLRDWLITKRGGPFQDQFEAYTLAALGAFAESIVCVERVLESYRLNGIVHPLSFEYRAFRELMEENPAAVGDALRNNERRLIAQAKFGELWQPTPFPFELANKT